MKRTLALITVFLIYFALISRADTQNCQVQYLMGVGKSGDRLKVEGTVTATGTVITGAVTCNAGAGWGTGTLATAANQVTGNASLTSIDGKITACNTGAVAGTVTCNAGTNLNTSALALESGNLLTAATAAAYFATREIALEPTLLNVRDYVYGAATASYSTATSTAALAAAYSTTVLANAGSGWGTSTMAQDATVLSVATSVSYMAPFVYDTATSTVEIARWAYSAASSAAAVATALAGGISSWSTQSESIATSTAYTALNGSTVAAQGTGNALLLSMDTTLTDMATRTTALESGNLLSIATSTAALAAAIATPTVVVQGASAPVSGAWPIRITDNTNVSTLLTYGTGNVTTNYSLPVLAFFDIAAGTVFSQAGIGGVNADAVTIAGNYSKGLVVGSRNYAWNGAAYDRMRVPTLTGTFAVSGASPQTCLAGAGAGKFNRVHEITFSADTAGLVTLADGMGVYYMAANTSITQQFKQGKRQSTANTAITITNAGAGNVTCAGTYNTE